MLTIIRVRIKPFHVGEMNMHELLLKRVLYSGVFFFYYLGNCQIWVFFSLRSQITNIDLLDPYPFSDTILYKYIPRTKNIHNILP